jgi:endoglucanase
MLNGAIKALKNKPNVKVYVDSSTWAGVDDSVNLLGKLSGMDGFSCNVSGYNDQGSVLNYASAVANKTGLHFIVDTSRNGNGNPHGSAWCNVTDTKIGHTNTFTTNVDKCDAFLWVKVPGESDGLGINDDGSHPRNDVPSAGTPWPEYHDAIYSGDWSAFKAKYHI